MPPEPILDIKDILRKLLNEIVSLEVYFFYLLRGFHGRNFLIVLKIEPCACWANTAPAELHSQLILMVHKAKAHLESTGCYLCYVFKIFLFYSMSYQVRLI